MMEQHKISHPRAAKKNPYQLGWVQALSLYPSLAVLVTTGIYLGCVEIPGNHVAALLLQWHGYAAALFLVSFGALLAKHAAVSWKANRNRVSGGAAVVLCGCLILTGILLYYTGADWLRGKIAGVHFWVGVVLAIWLPWHVVLGLLNRR